MPGVLHPVAASLITSFRSIEDRALRDHLASEKARLQGRLRRHGRHDVCGAETMIGQTIVIDAGRYFH